MSKITAEEYQTIAEAVVAKGKTPEEFRAMMIASGNKVTVAGKTYRDVYYVRVMALMHEIGEDGEIPEF